MKKKNCIVALRKRKSSKIALMKLITNQIKID